MAAEDVLLLPPALLLVRLPVLTDDTLADILEERMLLIDGTDDVDEAIDEEVRLPLDDREPLDMELTDTEEVVDVDG